MLDFYRMFIKCAVNFLLKSIKTVLLLVCAARLQSLWYRGVRSGEMDTRWGRGGGGDAM